MPKDHYPDEGHLRAYLLASGFTEARVDALDLETLAAGGRSDFETRIGCQLLADPTAAAWKFDPPVSPSGDLRFVAGGVPGFTTVASVVYQPTGGTAETLVLNTDYRLEPVNGPAQGRPYTRLVFLNRRWHAVSATDRGSLTVTGRRGAALTIPESAWLAMLYRAAWHAWEALTQATTGGMLSWKEGDSSEDYGVEAWSRLTKGWDEKFEAAVRQYRLLTF